MQKAKEEVRDATLDFETKSQALHDQISSLKDKINQKDAEIYSLNQEIAAH
jgi:peptidoglycan hydrolase CwlO-like protein